MYFIAFVASTPTYDLHGPAEFLSFSFVVQGNRYGLGDPGVSAEIVDTGEQH
jgi:hypothetical protein